VDNITGTVSSTPTNANTATGSGTSTTPAATLGAFADAANGTWAYYVAQESTTCTAGTGFTQVAERESTSLFDFSDATEFRDSNDTSVDATVGASAAWGMVALEIVEAAAGGSTPKNLMLLGVG
jgi:cytidylate kinase